MSNEMFDNSSRSTFVRSGTDVGGEGLARSPCACKGRRPNTFGNIVYIKINVLLTSCNSIHFLHLLQLKQCLLAIEEVHKCFCIRLGLFFNVVGYCPGIRP